MYIKSEVNVAEKLDRFVAIRCKKTTVEKFLRRVKRDLNSYLCKEVSRKKHKRYCTTFGIASLNNVVFIGLCRPSGYRPQT